MIVLLFVLSIPAVVIADNSDRRRREDTREDDRANESPPVIIYSIGVACIAREIDTGHAFEADGVSVGEDETVPDDEHAVLAVYNRGVVLALRA